MCKLHFRFGRKLNSLNMSGTHCPFLGQFQIVSFMLPMCLNLLLVLTPKNSLVTHSPQILQFAKHHLKTELKPHVMLVLYRGLRTRILIAVGGVSCFV